MNSLFQISRIESHRGLQNQHQHQIYLDKQGNTADVMSASTSASDPVKYRAGSSKSTNGLHASQSEVNTRFIVLSHKDAYKSSFTSSSILHCNGLNLFWHCTKEILVSWIFELKKNKRSGQLQCTETWHK